MFMIDNLFNRSLGNLGAYNAAHSRPLLAVCGIGKILQKQLKDPNADPNIDLDKELKHCLIVSKAIRLAKKEGPIEGKDRKYFLEAPDVYCGIKKAINKELTSDFSSENVDGLGKKVQEFWDKWEPRCDEMESLVEKIKSGGVKPDDCNEVLNYLHEISTIVEKNLGEEGRRAGSYISGFPVIY